MIERPGSTGLLVAILIQATAIGSKYGFTNPRAPLPVKLCSTRKQS